MKNTRQQTRSANNITITGIIFIAIAFLFILSSCESNSKRYANLNSKNHPFVLSHSAAKFVKQGDLIVTMQVEHIKNSYGVVIKSHVVRYHSFTKNIVGIDDTGIYLDTAWMTYGKEILVPRPFIIEHTQNDSLSNEPYYIHEDVDTIYVDPEEHQRRIDSMVKSDFEKQIKLF